MTLDKNEATVGFEPKCEGFAGPGTGNYDPYRLSPDSVQGLGF